MECIQKSQAIIVDGDNTLWKGIATKEIGKRYLISEARHLHLCTVISGLKASRRIGKLISERSESEVAALPEFYRLLTENNLGVKEEMFRYSNEFIKKNKIKVVTNLLEQVSDFKPIILVTGASSTVAEAAKSNFRIDHYISNIDLFDRGKLVGVKMLINTAEDKLTAVNAVLETLDMRIDRCTAIGDSRLDVAVLKAAGCRIASPLANKEVLSIKGIVPLRA